MKKQKWKNRKNFLKALFLFVPALGMVVGMSQINRVQQFLSYAFQEPANLSVDLNRSAGVPSRPWSYISQGGESDSFTLQPLQIALSELRPKYLRIDHLYDFYIKVSKNPDGKLMYDFSKLDALLLEMRQSNVLPFISLSYMPDILSSDMTGSPSNWLEYQQIIRQTIEHTSGKSELNIPNVYYEVWNEPDLFGNWKTYGNKNYLDMYTHAAIAAAKASDTQAFKIGGPATTRLYTNWMTSLMKLVADRNLRLDFISWHLYTLDSSQYREDINRLKTMMTDYVDKAKTLEIIISEWGPDSEIDPVYDNSISAAHLVASIVEMMPVIDKAFIFELEDGKSPHNEEYWGRWGLYTHRDFENHSKPRAEAIKLLNQLGTDRVTMTGNGFFVKGLSARKNQTVQILVTNYDQLNKHNENVPLTINGIKPGTYQLTKTFLSRSKHSQLIEIAGTTYQTSIPLAPNSVVLFELTPQ